jgi:hypothetical protein
MKKWSNLGFSRAASFLGRHSLQVFAWHVLIVGACLSYKKQWEHAHWSLQILATGIVISTLFVPAFLHKQWQTRRAVSVPLLMSPCHPVSAWQP